MSMKQVNNLNHMRVISHPLADVKRIAGVGKGTPAEVLEPEDQTVLREKSPLVVDHRDLQVGLDRHVQAAPKVRRHALRRLLAADVAGLALAGLLGLLVVSAISNDPSNSLSRFGSIYLFNLAVIPLFIGTFALYGLYRGISRRISISVFTDLQNIMHALIISGFLYAIVAYVATTDFGFQGLGVAKIFAMCLAAMIVVPVARVVSFSLFGRALHESVPVIVVGTGKLSQTVASHLRANSSVKFVGFVDDKPLGHVNVIGKLENLPELCRTHGVTRVVVCFSQTHPERTAEVLKSLAGQVGISIVPRYFELITNRSRMEDLSGLPMLDIAPTSLSARTRILKRSFDIVSSGLILIVVSPLIAVIALTIKLTSSGPVFFRQERTGLNEQPFCMMKFRTMYTDAEARRHEFNDLNEADGPLFKVRDDPRVTRLGRFLRRTSLDEIPQLINVWKGDMSLVGPRPFVVSESLLIQGWARKRYETRPGMTGLWQVSGRSELSHLELCRLDYLYVASWSFWWDMHILWQTPAAIFRGRGAS
jgi:exopolysaccharide biosynthesis polyprenyl glycosylphosphotransferase